MDFFNDIKFVQESKVRQEYRCSIQQGKNKLGKMEIMSFNLQTDKQTRQTNL